MYDEKPAGRCTAAITDVQKGPSAYRVLVGDIYGGWTPDSRFCLSI
jgi:hypothetical protein